MVPTDPSGLRVRPLKGAGAVQVVANSSTPLRSLQVATGTSQSAKYEAPPASRIPANLVKFALTAVTQDRLAPCPGPDDRPSPVRSSTTR